LLIRDVCELGADSFYAYMQHEEYWRDLPMDPPTREWLADMLRSWLQDQTKEPRTSFFMAATEKVTGKVIGEAILHIRRWQQGEIGWGVSSERGGQGLVH
jgi:[ribosomal protein S5]-alanine N-acetyltransferase